MKKFVLLTHGNWGCALKRDIIEQFGTEDELCCFPLLPEMNSDNYIETIHNDLLSTSPDKKITFICDLVGSTTYRAALSLALKMNAEAYSDLSIRLVLTLMNDEDPTEIKVENLKEKFENLKN